MCPCWTLKWVLTLKRNIVCTYDTKEQVCSRVTLKWVLTLKRHIFCTYGTKEQVCPCVTLKWVLTLKRHIFCTYGTKEQVCPCGTLKWVLTLKRNIFCAYCTKEQVHRQERAMRGNVVLFPTATACKVQWGRAVNSLIWELVTPYTWHSWRYVRVMGGELYSHTHMPGHGYLSAISRLFSTAASIMKSWT